MELKKCAAVLAAVAILAPNAQAASLVTRIQVAPTAGVSAVPSVIGAAGAVRVTPVAPLLAPSLTPLLSPVAAAPKVVAAAPAVGVAAAQEAFATLAQAPAIQTLSNTDASAAAHHPTALSAVYDKSGKAEAPAASVAGSFAAPQSGLSRAASRPSASNTAVAAAKLDSAAGSGVFIDGVKRLWDITVGKFLRWVTGREKKNVKALAAKLMAELEAELPKRAAAAAEIGKTAHLLKMQLDRETKEASRLDELANKAIEMGKDKEAEALLKQKEPLDASIAATTAQYEQAKKNQAWALQQVQDFYYEKQAAINKIRGMVARDEMASMEKRMNELKGTFKVGDIKGQMDKLEQIVDENEAEAKGMSDVTNNSGEAATKEIEDALKSDKVKEEIARRKAEIEKKKAGK